MTKEEWNQWYPKVRKQMADKALFWLDQSEAFQDALDRENYFTAQEIVFEAIEGDCPN